MPGLIPAIHVLIDFRLQNLCFQDVDARHQAGHEDSAKLHRALDHDDCGSNRSKIINVIDSNISRSGARAENRCTIFLIPP
jgi:hypothetical protein